MNIKVTFLAAFWVLLLSLSCNSEQFSFEDASRELRFSRDTMLLDTVYSQVRSETYLLTVYNNEAKNVSIPRIALEKGSDSPYRINVAGKSGSEFVNVLLRGRDSLQIFVEIAPTANGTEFLAKDRILFENAASRQYVTLLSVVQDAEFFIENGKNPNVLLSNTTWDSKKAKIIYGNLTVAEGKTLEIGAGTKVYFTKNSGLTIAKNAKLVINGDLNSEVIFRGDRNDPRYDTIPLNWKGIHAEPGAVLKINYAKISGGDTALYLNAATAELSNTIIRTFQNYGIYGIAADINAKNLVMNNFGQSAVGMYKGGSAEFTHCTLANFWNFNQTGLATVLYAANEWQNAAGNKEYGPLNLKVQNSVLYGKNEGSVIFKPSGSQAFNYLIYSSLLQVNAASGFTFENNPQVISSIRNTDPKFISVFNNKMNLRVAKESPVRGKGNAVTAQNVPVDLLKVSRISNPAMGAYQ